MYYITMWAPIPGFSGYEISSNGMVRNKHGKHIKPWLHTGRVSTYWRVKITNDKGIRKMQIVHRLVASSFQQGKTKARKFVNHIDKNSLNNHALNLEWCTHAENILHRVSYENTPQD